MDVIRHIRLASKARALILFIAPYSRTSRPRARNTHALKRVSTVFFKLTHSLWILPSSPGIRTPLRPGAGRLVWSLVWMAFCSVEASSTSAAGFVQKVSSSTQDSVARDGFWWRLARGASCGEAIGFKRSTCVPEGWKSPQFHALLCLQSFFRATRAPSVYSS